MGKMTESKLLTSRSSDTDITSALIECGYTPSEKQVKQVKQMLKTADKSMYGIRLVGGTGRNSIVHCVPIYKEKPKPPPSCKVYESGIGDVVISVVLALVLFLGYVYVIGTFFNG